MVSQTKRNITQMWLLLQVNEMCNDVHVFFAAAIRPSGKTSWAWFYWQEAAAASPWVHWLEFLDTQISMTPEIIDPKKCRKWKSVGLVISVQTCRTSKTNGLPSFFPLKNCKFDVFSYGNTPFSDQQDPKPRVFHSCFETNDFLEIFPSIWNPKKHTCFQRTSNRSSGRRQLASRGQFCGLQQQAPG